MSTNLTNWENEDKNHPKGFERVHHKVIATRNVIDHVDLTSDKNYYAANLHCFPCDSKLTVYLVSRCEHFNGNTLVSFFAF